MKLQIPLSRYLHTEYKYLPNFYILALMAGILTAAGSGIGRTGLGIGILIALGLSLTRRRNGCVMGRFVLFFILGAGAMIYRLSAPQTPVLNNPMYDVEIGGRIETATTVWDKQEIILGSIRFLNRIGYTTPDRIRLTFDRATPVLEPGADVTVRAMIRPPAGPLYPDGYNERRQLRFEGIGAVGRIREVLSLRPDRTDFGTGIRTIRSRIAERIRQNMPDEAARIAIPLTIGDQSVVTQPIYDLFRKSGITHILSVSGFHLSLLGLIGFILFRKLLAFCPAVSERISTKKLAGLFTLFLTTGYILISGMQVPAIRSWVMMFIVLIALWHDRNALSLRSLSVAAAIILICRPDLIFNIGFQLSFMAVLILTTLYLPLRRWIFPQKSTSFPGKFFRFLTGFALADGLMTLTLTPLIIYHFNQFAPYGVLGNILSGTLLSFGIMPLLFLALGLMPIGLDGPIFTLAGIGLEGLIALCEKIAALPASLMTVASFSATALLIMIGGVLWICFMKTGLRLIGIAMIGIGWIMALTEAKPDLLIADGGSTIAARRTDGSLAFYGRNPSPYTVRYWARHNGEDRPPVSVADNLPCRIDVRGKKIAFCPESCPTADICFIDEPTTGRQKEHPLTDRATRVLYFRQDKADLRKLE